jgi:hypothetical protein
MTPHASPEFDPFDLPEWLGEGQVTWAPAGGIHDSHLVVGLLTGGEGQSLPCALMAVDEAYPKPVAEDELRHQTHQAWRHGQVFLLPYDDGVGARPDSFSVLLRLGG